MDALGRDVVSVDLPSDAADARRSRNGGNARGTVAQPAAAARACGIDRLRRSVPSRALARGHDATRRPLASRRERPDRTCAGRHREHPQTAGRQDARRDQCGRAKDRPDGCAGAPALRALVDRRRHARTASATACQVERAADPAFASSAFRRRRTGCRATAATRIRRSGRRVLAARGDRVRALPVRDGDGARGAFSAEPALCADGGVPGRQSRLHRLHIHTESGIAAADDGLGHDAAHDLRSCQRSGGRAPVQPVRRAPARSPAGLVGRLGECRAADRDAGHRPPEPRLVVGATRRARTVWGRARHLERGVPRATASARDAVAPVRHRRHRHLVHCSRLRSHSPAGCPARRINWRVSSRRSGTCFSRHCCCWFLSSPARSKSCASSRCSPRSVR